VALLTLLTGGRLLVGRLLAPEPRAVDPGDEALRARALALHRDALVLDGHNDVPTWILDFGFELGMDGDEPNDRSPWMYAGLTWLPYPPRGDRVRTHTDLARIREGGLDAQFFSIWPACSYSATPGQARQRVLDMIESFRRQVDAHPEAIELAAAAGDVERIVAGGRTAALLGVEGGHAIEDDLENLATFHRLGVRYMTLTHSCSHAWADSSTDEPIANGLSDFGREVVREMNQLGMIVDIAHVSDATFRDVLEVTTAPVIASHSCARAIADHPRNLSDEMIRALAANGGVAMLNFSTSYLDPEKTSFVKVGLGWHWFWHPRGTTTPLSAVVDHIDHIVEVGGIDHVGLGSDFDGVPWLPEDLEDVADLPNITLELMRRGYSDEAVRKVLGRNAMRVLRQAQAVAAH
jgi:membrane dipeptidase